MPHLRFLLLSACAATMGCSDPTRPVATELLLDPADTTVVAGDRFQLRVTASNDGRPVDVSPANVSFSSSNAAVATVSPSGVVTTDHVGETVIHVSLRTRHGVLDATSVVRAGAIALVASPAK